MECHDLQDVLKDESQALSERRKQLFGPAEAASFENNKFGIALSGGGIRSATINLGFLRTLNLFKILEKADYLSTVSGGGYTGAYIQATLKEQKSYNDLFDDVKIDRLRKYGDYLIPGQGKVDKLWNTIVLVVGFLISWAMSLFSPAVTVAMIYLLVKAIGGITWFHTQGLLLDLTTPEGSAFVSNTLRYCLIGAGAVALAHLALNLFLNFNLGISKLFTKIETSLALAFLAFLLAVGIVNLNIAPNGTTVATEQRWWWLLIAAGLYLAGFLLNPNSLSFHRFYRKQLSDAFLTHTITCRNLLLRQVFPQTVENPTDCLAPYPLINTCLNLQNPGGDNKFKGAKASDYFLLSPKWCGSKLSGYVKTPDFPGFRHMTLPAALTISAAAVNPGMGIYSNKLLSVLMTLFNARLGFWVNNPSSGPRSLFGIELPRRATYTVWWPSFFFKELFSKIGTDNRKLNISDGGHIENLAVYELLRRRCRLIVAVDAGADPLSSFADLENLAIRARNELGYDLCFRPGNDPVDIIRPKASSGYAQQRFAIADVLQIWEEFVVEDDNGAPFLFDIKSTKGHALEKGKKLEALVNYFYSKDDRNALQFKIDLKARRGVDIDAATFDRLRTKAENKVKAELEAKTALHGMDKIKVGTLVYVKSSVTSPRKLFVPPYDEKGEKNILFDTFKYKIYHPDFPHESTADQFFDPVQWESYYQLGQYIAADILDLAGRPDDYSRQPSDEGSGKRHHDFSIDDLLRHFDQGVSLFGQDDRANGLVDVSFVAPVPTTDSLAQEALEVYAPTPSGDAAAPSPETQKMAMCEEIKFKI